MHLGNPEIPIQERIRRHISHVEVHVKNWFGGIFTQTKKKPSHSFAGTTLVTINRPQMVRITSMSHKISGAYFLLALSNLLEMCVTVR